MARASPARSSTQTRSMHSTPLSEGASRRTGLNAAQAIAGAATSTARTRSAGVRHWRGFICGRFRAGWSILTSSWRRAFPPARRIRAGLVRMEGRTPRRFLQVIGRRGRGFPAIGSTVFVLDRRRRKLQVGGVVERRDVHRMERAIERLDLQVSLAEGANPAVPAEVVVHIALWPFRRRRLVVTQRFLALQQAEVTLH